MVKPDNIDRLESAVPAAMAMLAGLELGVFTQLRAGPLSAKALAAQIGCGEERLGRLLHALVVAGLLQKRGDGFGNSAEAEAFLVEGKPRYRGSQHKLTAHLWETDLKTAQSIRSGRPAASHDFSKASDGDLLNLFEELHPGTIETGQDLLQAFDFSAARAVIDIGGGSGGLVATLCAAFPAMRGTLLELPRCAGLVEPLLRATPGGARVAIETGGIAAARCRLRHGDPACGRAGARARRRGTCHSPRRRLPEARRPSLHHRRRHSRRRSPGTVRCGLSQPHLPQFLCRGTGLYRKRAPGLARGSRLRCHATPDTAERPRRHRRDQALIPKL